MEAYVLLISGLVQGVGFRWFTEQEALERGLRGYVRNLPDGRVEVRAQGDEEILEEFFDRLRQGPPGARVEDVERRKVSVEPGLSSFHVSF